MIQRQILLLVTLSLSGTSVFGQSAAEHPEWPGKGQLFVGTCYQPVDRSPEQVRQDIALMKQAGFRIVEVPIVFADRTEGHSKMSRAIVLEAVWRVPLLRLRR